MEAIAARDYPLVQATTLIFAALMLSACASWWHSYEAPQINVTSFALAPDSSGVAPRFLIGLQVINPNRSALPLAGMSYSVEVEGNRILSGAKPDLPRIEGYSSADIVSEVSPDFPASSKRWIICLKPVLMSVPYYPMSLLKNVASLVCNPFQSLIGNNLVQ